jgi:hypothetical protein
MLQLCGDQGRQNDKTPISVRRKHGAQEIGFTGVIRNVSDCPDVPGARWTSLPPFRWACFASSSNLRKAPVLTAVAGQSSRHPSRAISDRGGGIVLIFGLIRSANRGYAANFTLVSRPEKGRGMQSARGYPWTVAKSAGIYRQKH